MVTGAVRGRGFSGEGVQVLVEDGERGASGIMRALAGGEEARIRVLAKLVILLGCHLGRGWREEARTRVLAKGFWGRSSGRYRRGGMLPMGAPSAQGFPCIHAPYPLTLSKKREGYPAQSKGYPVSGQVAGSVRSISIR
jgi:hypothetical protein